MATYISVNRQDKLTTGESVSGNISGLAPQKYILGIDLGTSSVGWAVIKADENDNPAGILDLGVRIFRAGKEGDLERGQDESRNKKRREARLARRQIKRRRRRKMKLFLDLQKSGLLPAGDKDEVICAIDQEILKEYKEKYGKDANYKHLYILRAKALDESLPPYWFGRAIYHLGQRRGFLSNRKAQPKASDSDERSKVKKGISELHNEIQSSGSRTLGEYFSTLNPHEARIRQRWTARKMYEEEFELIWDMQSKFHPELLSREIKEIIRKDLFYQRPLKNQKFLVGYCELEPNKKRARKALLVAQEFRLIQIVNNMKLVSKETGEILKLDEDQRCKVIEFLRTKKEASSSDILKSIGLKATKYKLNLDKKESKKKFYGNTTLAQLASVFGDKIHELSEEEKEQIVQDLISIQKEEVLLKRGIQKWGLTQEQAERFAEIQLEEGYLNVSVKAITKIMPLLEQGLTYAEAKAKIYPNSDQEFPMFDLLPALNSRKLPVSLKYINNPLVMRSLSELRKVVNAIIRKYGKPYIIRLELANELKKAKKEKEAIYKTNEEKAKKKKNARNLIASRLGIDSNIVTENDIEKYLLADECNWICPYTGKSISMDALFNSQFDVEHIIPYSLSFDNSFLNKTLCYHEENRNVKRNKTPYEAYSHTEKWEEILQRVKAFKTNADEKLRKFTMKPDEIEESSNEFLARQLNDTRYASQLARKYLGLLYGGYIDQNSKVRVQVNAGQVTALVRNAYGFNALLGGASKKTREDHRHHSVDALAIALISPGLIQDLRKQIKENERLNRKWNDVVLTPPKWLSIDFIRPKIEDVNVSVRISRKVRGPLHQETNYSPLLHDGYHHMRKNINDLSEKELERIVDPVVQNIVKKAASDAGGKPKKIKEVYMTSERKALRTPIKKVRVRNLSSGDVVQIGHGKKKRYVALDLIHHVEIFKAKDSSRSPVYISRKVKLYEAYQRKSDKNPIVCKEPPEDGYEYVFSLATGEIIKWQNKLWRLQTFRSSDKSSNRIQTKLAQVSDARKDEAIPLSGRQPFLNDKFLSTITKVSIDPLGNCRISND